MTHASDHSDSEAIPPEVDWRLRLVRKDRGRFDAHLWAPGDTVGAILRGEDLADIRKVRAAYFAQAGLLIAEGEAAKLRSLLPQLNREARELWASECRAKGVDEPFEAPKPAPVCFVSAKELAESKIEQTPAIDRVLVKGQPAIIAGEPKSMKTTTLIDMATSLAKPGGRFLNRFEVKSPGAVAFISCESGQATIKETFHRIALSKGLLPSSLPIHFCFDQLRISNDETIEQLQEFFQSNRIEYAVFDPAYMLLGIEDGQTASNLFAMGAILGRLTKLGQATGATIILAHHLTKRAGKDGAAVGMGDIAFAGFSEWARQFILIQRPTPYVEGSGHHDLTIKVASSAGNSGRWSVTIDEGPTGTLGNRSYSVEVQSVGDFEYAQAVAKAGRKAERERALMTEQAEKIEGILRQHFPNGATKSDLLTRAGMSGSKLNQLVAFMLDEGIIEPIEIVKGKKTYDGFRPQPDTPTQTRREPDSRGPIVLPRYPRQPDFPPYRGESESGSGSIDADGWQRPMKVTEQPMF